MWCKDIACYSCMVHISLYSLTESRYSMLTLLILIYSAVLWWRQHHQSSAALMWWLPPRWPFKLPGELLSQSCTDLSSRHMDVFLIKCNFRADNPSLIRKRGGCRFLPARCIKDCGVHAWVNTDKMKIDTGGVHAPAVCVGQHSTSVHVVPCTLLHVFMNYLLPPLSGKGRLWIETPDGTRSRHWDCFPDSKQILTFKTGESSKTWSPCH